MRIGDERLDIVDMIDRQRMTMTAVAKFWGISNNECNRYTVGRKRRMFRIFGPPGTGKTTTLLNMVDKALEEGTPPDRIAFPSLYPKSGK